MQIGFYKCRSRNSMILVKVKGMRGMAMARGRGLGALCWFVAFGASASVDGALVVLADDAIAGVC
jgi:hypothetical protein